MSLRIVTQETTYGNAAFSKAVFTTHPGRPEQAQVGSNDTHGFSSPRLDVGGLAVRMRGERLLRPEDASPARDVHARPSAPQETSPTPAHAPLQAPALSWPGTLPNCLPSATLAQGAAQGLAPGTWSQCAPGDTAEATRVTCPLTGLESESPKSTC